MNSNTWFDGAASVASSKDRPAHRGQRGNRPGNEQRSRTVNQLAIEKGYDDFWHRKQLPAVLREAMLLD